MPGGPVVREIDERALFAVPAEVDLLPVETAQQAADAFVKSPARPLSRPLAQRLSLAAGKISRATTFASALELDRGLLFLCVPVAMAAGVFAYLALPSEPSLFALAALSLLLVSLTLAARNRPALMPLLALATAVAVGAGFARLETVLASTKMLGSEISTVLTGRVVDIEHLANGRVRMTLDVLATERPKLRFAPERVRVSAASVPAALKVGDSVNGVARLFPPSGPLRPGSYDFAYEAYFDGLGGNGFFFRAPRIVEATVAVPITERLHATVVNLRNSIAAHIEEQVAGKAEGEIVAALIVGTRAGIPEDVNESLRRTGLAHILSISGLHMALVAVSVMGAIRLGLAALPGFASRRAVKKAAALAAMLAITGYLLISGAEVAALRSFIMLAVMLVAVIFDRAALTMRNLAIAAIITLVVSPHEVVGPSFQMSFAATAALIGGFQLWSDYRRAHPRTRFAGERNLLVGLAGRGIAMIAIIAVTSILAGLATTIYGVWHFQRISPLSLVANVAVSPIITLAMWTGVLASAAAPFGLDGPVFALMGKLVGLMLSISAWLSDRTPVDAVGSIPAASVVLFTVALIVGALSTTWMRWAALLPLVLGVMLIANRSLPEILVSEDAKLVAWADDDRIAVSRDRPNGFTIEDWQRAAAATELLKPASESQTPKQGQFVCNDGVCLATRDGTTIVHAEKAEQVESYCNSATLIVLADATARPCGSGKALVITARDLAQRGTASIRLTPGEPLITYAIDQPYRPWHDHRRFSRAARGIAPFVPRKRESAKAAVAQ